MVFFVYKLNVGANIAKDITEYSIDYLKNSLVVDVLNEVLNLEDKVCNLEESTLLKAKIPVNSKNEETFLEEWGILEKLTARQQKLYEDVIKNYREKNQIYYSEEFLSLTKKCGDIRQRFEKDYPNLKGEVDLKSNRFIDKKFSLPVEPKVGTGITHLRKFYKIKDTVESHSIDFFINRELEFSYNPKTEHILIESENQDSSIISAEQIQHYLRNNNRIKEELGNIKIIPVYSEFEIKDYSSISEIEYTVVYPNPVSERVDDALLGTLRKTVGEEQTTKISKLQRIELLWENLKELASVGYLKSIFIKRNRRTEELTTTIRTIQSEDEDEQ